MCPPNIRARTRVRPLTGQRFFSTSSRLLKNGFFVILNEVKDLEPIDMTRFFASLRMTMGRI
jgi:hypothetical protein